MVLNRWNRKLFVPSGKSGKSGAKLRVWHTPQKGIRAPNVLVKCGDCSQKIKIFFDRYGMEINGVNTSWDEWNGLFAAIKAARNGVKYKKYKSGR